MGNVFDPDDIVYKEWERLYEIRDDGDRSYMLEVSIRENLVLRETLREAISCPGICGSCEEPGDTLLDLLNKGYK